MRGKGSKSPHLRVFVALDLPEDVLAEIGAWGRKALGDPALRPVAPESLHITLAFLGSRSEGEVERIGELLRACRVTAPRIELLDPVARPARGRPGLFAVPVRSPEVERLQATLRERFVEAGLYEPQKRSFWPHVTVARVRAEGSGSRRPMRVADPPTALCKRLREHVFESVRLTLYLSELQPQGARYTPLTQIELPKRRQ